MRNPIRRRDADVKDSENEEETQVTAHAPGESETALAMLDSQSCALHLAISITNQRKQFQLRIQRDKSVRDERGRQHRQCESPEADALYDPDVDVRSRGE